MPTRGRAYSMICIIIIIIIISYITLYNTVFTFWPVVIKAIFDEDLYYTRVKRSTMVGSRRLSIAAAEARAKNDILKQHYPKLYYIGQRNTIFTTSRL
jgi:hypothetical protein